MSSPPSAPPAKRVRFSESVTTQRLDGPEASTVWRPLVDSRHSLDSDEEEDGGVMTAGADEGNDGRLREEDIEGQEEATIANDDGIAITPFNMREEMREGYFDAAGCYIFNKEEKEVQDSWLESVDWDSVKRQASTASKAKDGADKDKAEAKDEAADSEADGGDSDSDTGSEDLGPSQLAGVCAAARVYLLPGETIAAAIKRLGGGANRALSASQRLRLKKSGGTVSSSSTAEAAANRQRMSELSDLAGRLVTAGHMTAYQMDSAQLARLGGVGDAEASASAASAAGAGGMDMFADDDNGNQKSAAKVKPDDEAKSSSGDKAATNQSQEIDELGDAGVQWYYRVADDSASELLGPFSSEQMLRWAESDTGWPGGHRTVFVRKRDAEPAAPFYSSTRIDFDLYV